MCLQVKTVSHLFQAEMLINMINLKILQCSVTCGEGIETRDVVCYRGNGTVDESECSDLQRPISTQLCEEDRCIEPNCE